MFRRFISFLLILIVLPSTLDAQRTSSFNRGEEEPAKDTETSETAAGEAEKNKEPADHVVFAELGGGGVAYKVAYAYRLLNFTLGAGLTVAELVGWPVALSSLTGEGGHYFEIQAGAFPHINEKGKFKSIYNGSLGYVYWEEKGGLFFRGALYLQYDPDGFIKKWNIFVLPWAGVSAGKTF